MAATDMPPSSPRSGSLPPSTPLERANTALDAARSYRAEWMESIESGLVSPLDLFAVAAADRDSPLRRLRLVRVLKSRPRWTAARANDAVGRIARATRTDPGNRAKLSVGWLVDSRSHGRRIALWVEIVETSRDTPPWPGFPWNPPSAEEAI